jgi:hypothetical protein
MRHRPPVEALLRIPVVYLFHSPIVPHFSKSAPSSLNLEARLPKNYTAGKQTLLPYFR